VLSPCASVKNGRIPRKTSYEGGSNYGTKICDSGFHSGNAYPSVLSFGQTPYSGS